MIISVTGNGRNNCTAGVRLDLVPDFSLGLGRAASTVRHGELLCDAGNERTVKAARLVQNKPGENTIFQSHGLSTPVRALP